MASVGAVHEDSAISVVDFERQKDSQWQFSEPDFASVGAGSS